MTSASESQYKLKEIKSWQDLLSAESEFDGIDQWGFRGQDTPDFPASSLERHCRSSSIKVDSRDLEVKLIRDFARRYSLYAGYAPPAKGFTLEWLSILRHYGAPTRLIDFTYSFFMAAFFALESEKKDPKPVVWAVNLTRLAKAADEHFAQLPDAQGLLKHYNEKKDGPPFRNLFMRSTPIPFVYTANPLRLNERLTIQQGLFLAAGDTNMSFEANLRAVPKQSDCVMQLLINPSFRREALGKLHRMGINNATLFPGLEGFAKSLYTKSLILQTLPKQDADMLEEV